MVELFSETDFVSNNAEFQALAKDIAMHITAANPQYVSWSDISEDVKKKTEDAFMSEVKGKLENIQKKIIEGKLKSYFSERILMEQPFVKNPDVTIGQMIVLDRRLKAKVPKGPKHYEPKTWIATSIPIFIVEGFYLLLTYVDILALEHFRSPDEVAVYFAGARLLAIVAFVYFAIAGATTHKFTEYHVAGDKEKLASFFRETIKWTFWPSLACCALILAFGQPLLALFGAGFENGYGVMFILSIGLLARAAVGHPGILLAGSAGLARSTASAWGYAAPAPALPGPGGWLVVGGAVPAARGPCAGGGTARRSCPTPDRSSGWADRRGPRCGPRQSVNLGHLNLRYALSRHRCR